MLAPTMQSAPERASFALPAPESASEPFIYDRPVRGDEFLDRTSELFDIFNNLYLGVSTTISGTPRIGKSSLLLQVADKTIQRKYLADDVHQFVFVFLDLHAISSDYTPSTFWKQALAPLWACAQHATYARLAEQAAEADYSPRSLELLFEHMGQQEVSKPFERRLVLLLDEFDSLLLHDNFKDPIFFALLRHLATVTGGLAIVLVSRFSVAEMNRQAWHFKGRGSPLFNYMSELRPGPFDHKTVDLLLDRGRFDTLDRAFIRRVAGGHPFLLQCMADILLIESGDDRHVCAAHRFYERVAFHFDELWYTLDDHTRTTALILSLLELSRWIDHGLKIKELEKVEKPLGREIFRPELVKLAELGLAEQVGTNGGQNALMWRGERWRVGSQAFAWWVRDEVIAQTLWEPASYEEWRDHKRYRFLLTQAQSNWLATIVPNTPQWTAPRALGGAFFNSKHCEKGNEHET